MEINDILKEINNLLPWDKETLLDELVSSKFLPYDVTSNILSDNGFVDENSIDPVQMVIDNNCIEDVMFEVDDYDLAQELYDRGENAIGYLFDILDGKDVYLSMDNEERQNFLKNITQVEMVDFLEKAPSKKFEELINAMLEANPLKTKEIIKKAIE